MAYVHGSVFLVPYKLEDALNAQNVSVLFAFESESYFNSHVNQANLASCLDLFCSNRS